MKKSLLKIAAAASMAALLVVPVSASAAQAQTIYVDAINGSDAASGSEASPVQTLKKAQELARALRSENAQAEVVLRQGVYTLDEPLVFEAEDSGTKASPVVWRAYPGETPVLSGGAELEGWEPAEEGSQIFKTSAQGIVSRDLYVNGERAEIASQPLEAYEYTKKYIYADASALPDSFARMDDLEVIFARKWKWNVQKIASCSDNDDYENCKRFKLSDETYDNHKKNMTGAAIDAEGMRQGVIRVQNALELLDEPGEWYLDDDTDTVYYMPKEGEDLTEAKTVLGRLENMIVFDGSSESRVHDIAFEGLSFQDNTWNKPSERDGLQTFQAAAAVHYDDDWNREWIPETGSAIYGTYTTGISITNCDFANLGDAAIHLSRSTKNAKIDQNTFQDLGGSAVILGNVEFQDHVPTPEDLSEGSSISNNTVLSVSQTYRGNAGILVGFARSTTVDHNWLEHLPYTGISVGWGWGYNDFNANTYFRIGKNSITNNMIKDVLEEPALIDGGGIYTLGRQDDSVMKGNVIDGVHNEYGGIYLDEGTVGYTITDNVVTNCVRNYLYKGDYNYIWDNYSTPALEPDRDERLAIGDILHYRFENNDLWDEEAVAELYENAGPVKKENVSQVMFRLYNPNSGEHFYTASASENDTLVKAGWKEEGTAWTAPKKSGTPVYRLYNPNAGDHHYTISTHERDYLISEGWRDEGIGWYSSETRETAIYRLYNPNAKSGAHHYTADFKEYTSLGKLGWKQESIAWYGME